MVDPAAWFRHTGLCPGVPGRCGARDAARRGPDGRRGRGDRLVDERTGLSPCFPAASAWGGGRGSEPEMEVWQLKTPRVKCSTRVTRVSVEDEHKAVKASRLSEDF